MKAMIYQFQSSVAAVLALSSISLMTTRASDPDSSSRTNQSLAHEIFQTMLKLPGVATGQRPVHARGVLCQGTFVPSTAAAQVSRAAHFQPSTGDTRITIRFSDGASDPSIPENIPNGAPRGMAIRFHLPGNEETDIVAMSHHGFVVANGQEFLELQRAVVATNPTEPHPWPIEKFLSHHPRALKFVQENAIIPASFATESFFSNDSFVFINSAQIRQIGRYQLLPFAGSKHLSASELQALPPDFLMKDLQERLPKESIEFRLVLQLPDPGDQTDDPSSVWPPDRRTVELGRIRITSLVTDAPKAERALAFDPTNLTTGIELSDDELPTLRSEVYALSARERRKAGAGAILASPSTSQGSH